MVKANISFHTRLNPPTGDFVLKTDKPSKTEQQYRINTDINSILQRFALTGDESLLNAKKDLAQYGDFSQFDYDEAMYKVAAVKTEFEQLPYSEKLKYHNNPSEWYNDKLDDLLRSPEPTSVTKATLPTIPTELPTALPTPVTPQNLTE